MGGFMHGNICTGNRGECDGSVGDVSDYQVS